MPGAPRADELPRVRKPKLRELPTPKWAKTFGLSFSKCSETCCPDVGKGHVLEVGCPPPASSSIYGAVLSDPADGAFPPSSPLDGAVLEGECEDERAPCLLPPLQRGLPPRGEAAQAAPPPIPAVIELNAVDISSTHDALDITVDSGAGATVCSPSHFPESPLTDSPGSLKGQVFAGPGGELIPNQGQLQAKPTLENGAEAQLTFQAADVVAPLLAVSSVNDKGNLVLFDPQGSFIIPAHNAALIGQMRQLVKKMTGKVDLHRKNGVYKMRAWRAKPGFARQGR